MRTVLTLLVGVLLLGPVPASEALPSTSRIKTIRATTKPASIFRWNHPSTWFAPRLLPAGSRQIQLQFNSQKRQLEFNGHPVSLASVTPRQALRARLADLSHAYELDLGPRPLGWVQDPSGLLFIVIEKAPREGLWPREWSSIANINEKNLDEVYQQMEIAARHFGRDARLDIGVQLIGEDRDQGPPWYRLRLNSVGIDDWQRKPAEATRAVEWREQTRALLTVHRAYYTARTVDPRTMNQEEFRSLDKFFLSAKDEMSKASAALTGLELSGERPVPGQHTVWTASAQIGVTSDIVSLYEVDPKQAHIFYKLFHSAHQVQKGFAPLGTMTKQIDGESRTVIVVRGDASELIPPHRWLDKLRSHEVDDLATAVEREPKSPHWV